MRYREGNKQNRDVRREDAAFAGWHEIISYIPGFWEKVVTRGKGDKGKLIASRSHSFPPHPSVPGSTEPFLLPGTGKRP